MLNLVSSPGSGKTTLLVKTITDLKARYPIAVIEGDQQTANDAERIRATGAPAVQINTGKGCHLDAHMVGHALDAVAGARQTALLFIENVGNLVCPAAFDLGEAHKVVVLSVTEGEDKPLKYPDMFAAADLLLLNKIDLLPHLDFDVGRLIANTPAGSIRRSQVLTVSAKSGEGMPAFYAWIAKRAAALARRRQGRRVARWSTPPPILLIASDALGCGYAARCRAWGFGRSSIGWPTVIGSAASLPTTPRAC